MAKVYATPAELGPAPQISDFITHSPSYNFDRKAYNAAEAKFIQAVKDYCLKNGKGVARGKQISFSVADGEARYVIFNDTTLFHLNLIDGYQFRYLTGMTAKAIREQAIAQERYASALGSMFEDEGADVDFEALDQEAA